MYTFTILRVCDLLCNFTGDSTGKESTCNVGDLSLKSGLGRSPGEGKSYPLQYSGLDNSMDCIVHGAHRVGHDWVTFTFTDKQKQLSHPFLNLFIILCKITKIYDKAV